MKLTAALLSLTLSLLALPLPTISTMTPAEAKTHCGALGVMQEYTDAYTARASNLTDIRACREHPAANSTLDGSSIPPPPSDGNANAATKKRRASPADVKGAAMFEVRDAEACYYRADFGCSVRGYCWRACGDKTGHWCWTAKGENGKGAWLTCSTYADCPRQASCGHGVLCGSCGCGC